jgi:hypothetical protein
MSEAQATLEKYELEQLAHCKNCDTGDPVLFLDIDGTQCKVSGDTVGELCHASGEYWWPCPRWHSLAIKAAAHSALVEAAQNALTALRYLRDKDTMAWDLSVTPEICNAWDDLRDALALAQKGKP